MVETISAEEGHAWLALARIKQIGGTRAMKLVAQCGSATAALEAPARSWESALGRVGRAARSARIEIDWARDQYRRLQAQGGHLLTLADNDYPVRLKQISSPPPLLYVLGSVCLNHPLIAIVGTRRASRYGEEMASRLTRELVTAGLGVVSGLARGVDTCVHRATLRAGGRTVAVLGSGVDVCYPPENKDTCREIRASGAVLSEFPMGTEPVAPLFPRRNRLISGLSLGTIVIEASQRSGALITANYALEQNREVFAVPGDVSAGRSSGCHRLIKEGAKLVESATDVLEELQGQFAAPAALGKPLRPTAGLEIARHPADPGRPGEVEPQPPAASEPLSNKERKVMGLLGGSARHIDELSRTAELSPPAVMEMMLRLELDGWVERLPGQYYARL
jgi:DNA processing protein